MQLIEKERYRFSTRTGVLADAHTGRPVGRVLRASPTVGASKRPRFWRWRAYGAEGLASTRTAAHAALVAHLDEASA